MQDIALNPSETSVAQLLRERRTINDFKAEVPPMETILQAVEVARWAPNHKMTEPWRFQILGPQTQAKIVDLNSELVAASKGVEAGEKKRERWSRIPGWIAVSSLIAGDDELRTKENYAATCCAVQNLSLFLWSEGIGVKWTTGPVTRDPRVYEILGKSPEQEDIVGVLWYGYPEKVPQTRRRPVNEICTELP